MAEQDEVIHFLAARAETRLETHISLIFLAGETAYKLKRAVRFSYLDYSTLALRRHFCEAELALNRRTAPCLYRHVRAITRAKGGGLEWDGPGKAVEYVLEMQRFPQAALLDEMAKVGTLTADKIRALADEIAAFHVKADRVPGDAAGLGRVIEGNAANLLAACPPLPPQDVAMVNAATRAAYARHAALLDARGRAGHIRRCHGDLHLGNILWLQGRPVLFDCIEFSEDFACIDVLYDLAFLLMDLCRRGFAAFAAQLANRYFDRVDEEDGLALLPFFMSIRAAVRAHVLAAQKRNDEAGSCLALAAAALRPATPCLMAIGGRSGTGKSTLAAALAGYFAPMPGARVLRSDVLRKRLCGVAAETKLPADSYTKEMSARVYAAVFAAARAGLAAGMSVILDAAFLNGFEREAAEALAMQAGVAFHGVWLEAPEELLAARLQARRGDASDADPAVMRRQRNMITGAMTWRRLDAATPVAAQISALTPIPHQ